MTTASADQKRPLETSEDGRPRFRGCSRITEYEWISKLGEGTFGEVSKARSKKTGQIVALKKILMHHEKDGFPITALREIKLLKQLDHINILKLEEMAVERPKDVKKKPSMFMVTPYMDHDLSGLLENPAVHFNESQIKCYMKQLLEGTAYLHENRILHRDMKAANLLISNRGILQIADFGLARPYEGDPPKPGQGGGEATRDYTTLVVTRWYRPPELLLLLRRYTTAVDMWGVGCVFGEMFKGKPILAGASDLNQAQLIFDLVGSPTEENMPGWSELPGCEGVKEFTPRPSALERGFRDQGPLTISLLSDFLRLDWRKRINAIDALKHPYFHTHPLPARPEDLPSFEDSHELDRRKFRDQKNKPPPAPAGGSVGIGPQGEWGINGRPLYQDGRGGGRIPGGGRPYANGHGVSNRRPPALIPPSVPNGDFVASHRHPLRPHDGPRAPMTYDDRQTYNNRMAPRIPPQDPYASHQPHRPPLLPPLDYNGPPQRLTEPDTGIYRQQTQQMSQTHLAHRDWDRETSRGRGFYQDAPSQRVPTGAGAGAGPPQRAQQPAYEVDTYIPSYAAVDPNDRRPPSHMSQNVRRDRWRDEQGGTGPRSGGPRQPDVDPMMDYGDAVLDRGPEEHYDRHSDRGRERDYPYYHNQPAPRRRSRSPYRGERDWERDRQGGGNMYRR